MPHKHTMVDTARYKRIDNTYNHMHPVMAIIHGAPGEGVCHYWHAANLATKAARRVQTFDISPPPCALIDFLITSVAMAMSSSS